MKTILALFACACLALPAQAQPQAPERPPITHAPPLTYILKEVTGSFPKADQLEARVRTSTIQPGAVGEWHTHATPVIVYVLEGTLSIEVKDKGTMHHKAGEAAMEPINTVLRASNQGQGPAKLVVFQVSPPDVPFSHPVPQQ
jgi:quercetin dioxygenase-like cupin family protein